jgi:microcystin-dependent protein
MTDHPELHAVIGTMYCPGPCSSVTKFAVPDMRGRTVVHQGGTVLNGVIGTQVGTETHTLSTAEMPTHTHSGITDAQGTHTHAVPYTFTTNTGGSPTFFHRAFAATGTFNNLFADPEGNHFHNLLINSAGSGGPHNNIQPSMVMQYLIKT